MTEKICPICNRENLPEAKRCWYCQAVLPEADAEPAQSPASGNDWLDSLRSEPATEPPEKSSTDAEQSRSAAEGEEKPFISSDTPENTADSEVPEWLQRIRMRKQAELESAQKTEPELDQSRDWLEEIRGKQSAEPKGPDSEEKDGSELPDWIADLQSESLDQSTPPAGVSDQEPSGAEEDNDWLKKLAAWNAEPVANESAEENPVENQPVHPEPTPEESTPDWLRSFLGEPETPPLSAVPPVGSEQNQIAEERLRENAISDEEKASFSEFMKRIHDEPQEEKAGSHFEEEGIQPDSSIEEPVSAANQPEEVTPQDEGYDFTAEAGQLSGSISEESTIPPAAEEPAPEPAAEETSGSEEPSQKTTEEPGLPLQASEADLDWLSEYHEIFEEEGKQTFANQAGGQQEKTAKPFLGAEKYDWAAGSRSEKVEGDAEDIEMAKLPPWLQKLRSVDSIPLAPVIEPVETKPESEGPLAGIEGTLQSSEVAELYTKPPIYSTKVQVTERQSMRADLLRSMVEKRAQIGEAAETTGKTHFNVVKLIVGLVLIMAAAAAMILQPGSALLPALYPLETANTFTLVNSIPVEKPVLVAADFEPGLSGEIILSSQMLVENLMLRNLSLVTLSTNPTGSAMMDSILTKAQTNVGGYDRVNRVTSLGYLPGGSVGLQGFANDPVVTMPYTSQLTPAWELPILQNVHSVSDFGAVIVITEDADTARYWVEQVQPRLGSTPLIVVSSAQAAPMLQPYYDSGQISGMISGLSGGAVYEQIIQRPGSAVGAYGAYQIVLVILILIIFFGGAVSIIRNATRTNRE